MNESEILDIILMLMLMLTCCIITFLLMEIQIDNKLEAAQEISDRVLLDKGVTGKPGQFKKALAGWLEFFPEFAEEKIEDYSNAQLFALLGRMMTGPMRHSFC